MMRTYFSDKFIFKDIIVKIHMYDDIIIDVIYGFKTNKYVANTVVAGMAALEAKRIVGDDL